MLLLHFLYSKTYYLFDNFKKNCYNNIGDNNMKIEKLRYKDGFINVPVFDEDEIEKNTDETLEDTMDLTKELNGENHE